MEIVNFGLFTPSTEAGIVLFASEDGQDWYSLRDGLTNWDKSNGAFIDAVYGAWAMVDPSTMRVTNVEYDPSRLMPGNRIVLGIDADVSSITAGMSFQDGQLLPPQPEAVTVDDIANERDRRLAQGFNYDFGDGRGVHQIATTDADMRRWMDEVTPLAQAKINLGTPNGTIAIMTVTGHVAVSAMEWQHILLAAASYRQPLYAASFALQAMTPIPSDFATNPAYWP